MSTDSDPDDRPWHPSEALLHRFVDGDVGGSDRSATEALLASDRDAFDDVRTFQHQNILMKALHPRRAEDGMLPPAALNLARGLRRQRFVQRAAAASVAGLALLGAGTVGWHTQGYVERMFHTPVVAVFPPATVAATTDGGGENTAAGLEMSPMPTATGTVVGDAPGWLGKNVRRVPVHPPNLQAVGFQLVDGRADLTSYGPVIRFAYTPSEGGESPRLALTVASFGSDRQSLATTINPQHASLFWQSGQLLYALSGDVSPGQLLNVANAVGPAETAPSVPAEGGADAKAEGPGLPATPVSEPGETTKEL